MVILRDEAGFTLIELVVVIAIIGLLSTLAVVNFGPAANRVNVEATARDISSTVSLAHQKASSQALVSFQGGAPRVPDEIRIVFSKSTSKKTPWKMQLQACQYTGSSCTTSVDLRPAQVFSSDLELSLGKLSLPSGTALSFIPPSGDLSTGGITIRVSSLSHPDDDKSVVISAIGQATLQ